MALTNKKDSCKELSMELSKKGVTVYKKNNQTPSIGARAESLQIKEKPVFNRKDKAGNISVGYLA